MALRIISRLSPLTHRLNSHPAAFSASRSGSGGSLTVKHDREQRRFTVAPGSGAGDSDCAVLKYQFTGEKEVHLLSTFVPETFRGRGIAALLSQAAMDFLLEENVKARVSCWYIKKYVEEHQHYKHLLIS